MKVAAQHPKETERLASLASLNILDTLPEKEFDEITLIASTICNTPAALVTLVDASRQWFKSRIGVEAPETSRDVAFCAHAILQDEVFVIEDSFKDSRFFDNPLATGETHVRFYAGAPLKSPDGLPIGTVCVIDSKPRKLDERQVAGLRALANQAEKLLELRISIKSLTDAQRALSESQKVHKSVMDGIPALVGYWSRDLINLSANKVYRDYFGMDPDEMKGKSMAEVMGRSLLEKNFPYVKGVLEGKTQTFERDLKHRDGSIRNTLANYIPVHSDGKVESFFVVVTDITEIKKLEIQRQTMESRLSESARLSTLGEMAGGIAHEINNPLAIIKSVSELISSKLKNGPLTLDKCEKHLDLIRETVDRIAKITRGLRAYARDGGNDPFENAVILAIVEDTLAFCSEKFKQAHVDLTVSCDQSLKVECRPAQISQIVLNVLNNSFDAVEELQRKWIQVDVQDLGSDVELKFTDSGSGIPEPIANKLMQPFFTTKPIGKGTGLGLSISQGIAASHGGSFTYVSGAPNTTFVLKLPKKQLRNSKE